MRPSCGSTSRGELAAGRQGGLTSVGPGFGKAVRPGNAIPPGDLNAENDRADGRASFLRAPDTVAPPVALEPDNSPSRAPGFPGNEREIGAQNLRNLAAGVRWSGTDHPDWNGGRHLMKY